MDANNKNTAAHTVAADAARIDIKGAPNTTLRLAYTPNCCDTHLHSNQNICKMMCMYFYVTRFFVAAISTYRDIAVAPRGDAKLINTPGGPSNRNRSDSSVIYFAY